MNALNASIDLVTISGLTVVSPVSVYNTQNIADFDIFNAFFMQAGELNKSNKL